MEQQQHKQILECKMLRVSTIHGEIDLSNFYYCVGEQVREGRANLFCLKDKAELIPKLLTKLSFTDLKILNLSFLQIKSIQFLSFVDSPYLIDLQISKTNVCYKPMRNVLVFGSRVSEGGDMSRIRMKPKSKAMAIQYENTGQSLCLIAKNQYLQIQIPIPHRHQNTISENQYVRAAIYHKRTQG